MANEDDECHVRRVINRSGRSRAYIGGTPTLQILKEFRRSFSRDHGQHEHQSLLRRDAQRQLLTIMPATPRCLTASRIISAGGN
ncbi:MAG: hypothetical protein R3F37_18775 [Candidatus Competibacteraceae bacterium]